MNRTFVAAAALLALLAAGSTAVAGNPQNIRVVQSYSLPWHGADYHTQYGTPIALVVPPTAEFQSNYGWGVGGTRVVPIYHQFGRPYPGDYGYGGSGFRPMPHWPSDTQQFGVYYIRGPWGTY